ncbi:putative cytochrome P450 [Arabidopsis thaliana]
MSEIYVLALSVVFSLIVVKLCHWVYQWSNPKCKGKLPPGSMGFPIIGETFEFMTPFDISLVVSPYLKKRISRYGSKVFRTSLFGAKVIVSIDPDVNMEIAKASSQLRATESVTRIFGENNPFLQSKEIHKYVRNLTSRFVGPEGLKTRLIHDIDNLLRNDVENGARNGSFDVREATIKMVGELIAKKIMGETESEAVKELGLCWSAFRTSWFQFSYNIPGTTVYRLVKARRKAAKLLKALILKKIVSKEGLGDFLDIIFDEMEKDGAALDIDKAVNLIFVFFILSQETTPGVQGAVVKLVADHPSVMEELQREHEAIVQNRADKDTGVTWEEYKSMTFTHMVIKESLRFTSTQPTVHRILDQDVQIGDYTLPAGWLFFGIPQVHFDEEKYDDPLTFNPWRWQGKDIHSTVSREYMPFGAGGTHCVGSEFAKVIIAILLHHLSRFRWSLDPKTKVLRRYTLVFPAGCVVHISKESE